MADDKGGKLINHDFRKPRIKDDGGGFGHLTVPADDGVHVLPIAVLMDIVDGVVDLHTLSDPLLIALIRELLAHKGFHKGE